MRVGYSLDSMTYGPLPSERESRYGCALSTVFALVEASAPCAFAAAELITEKLRWVRNTRSAGAGMSEVITTVYGSGAETARPAILIDPGLKRFFSRLYEKTTSADVTGVLSANLA